MQATILNHKNFTTMKMNFDPNLSYEDGKKKIQEFYHRERKKFPVGTLTIKYDDPPGIERTHIVT